MATCKHPPFPYTHTSRFLNMMEQQPKITGLLRELYNTKERDQEKKAEYVTLKETDII